MIRALLMIAGAGFVLAAGSFAAAVAIGGPDAVARGGWNLLSHTGGRWGSGEFHHHDHGRPALEDGAQASRTLAWDGSEHLDVDLPADIRYIQTAGDGSVELKGDESLITRISLHEGHLRLEGEGLRHWQRHRLQVVVHAPNVSRFDLSGANTLTIEGYKQDKLTLDVSGAAEVTATGETQAVDIEISGTGDVDLARLKTRGAQVDISGSGGAIIAPTEWANLEISGMGDIRLLTRPPKLETDVSGAGRIRELGPPSAATAPAPPKQPVPGAKT